MIARALAALLMITADRPAREAGAGGEPAPARGAIALRHCQVEYDLASTVGSPMLGVIGESRVEPGDRVRAGQLLGRLRDEEAQADLVLRTAEARDDVEIRLARARSIQTASRLRASEALRTRGLLSREEYNLHRLEAESSALAVEQAERKRALAQLQLRRAEAVLRSRDFVAPHDGVVTAVLKRTGEPVGQNEGIYRVVDVERLRVTGRIDVVDSWRVRPGQAVRVVADIAGADLPVEREVFEGRVAFVDSQIDPQTRTCSVVARIDNLGGRLRSGLEARMEILVAEPESAGHDEAPRMTRAERRPLP